MKLDPARSDAHRYPYVMQIEPRFADMDIVKHINNLSLAEYLEEVRARFYCDIFGQDFLFRARDYRLLVAHASYDYLNETHYLQTVEARAALARIGNSSFELVMALFQNQRCVCQGNVVTVCTNDAGSRPLPEDIRTALAPWQFVAG